MMMTNLVTLLSLFCCVGGGSGGGGADVVVQGFKTRSTTIFGFTFPVISSSFSSTKLNTSNTKFHWTASLDTTTGIATSKETSITSSSLFLSSITVTTQQQRNKKKMITDVLCSYPTWLVKPRISFGLLQIMPVHTLQEAQQLFRHDQRRARTTTSTSTTTIQQFHSKNKNKNNSHSNSKEDNTNNNTGSNIIGTSICDGIFRRINLLTFGNPIISYTNDNKKQVVLQRGGNKKGRTHIPTPNPNTVIVDFPIIGGLLATITSSLSSSSSSSSSSLSSSTSNNDNNKDKEHCHNNGCIRLVITTHDEPEEEVGYDDTRQQKQQHKRRQQQHRSVTKIETSICQEYHPAIAVSSSSLPLLSSSSSSSEQQQRRENARGEEALVTTLNLPIHPGRKVLYLSTQSLIHAYVMWRFHGYVSSQISNCNEMK